MKKIKILLIALILILGGTLFSNTYATTRELGAQLNRPFTNSKYQYLVPSNTTDVKYTVVKIYDNADKIDNELAFAKALYCLRGGKGFGANVQEDGTDISTTPITYTELGEMHENAKDVIDKYYELYGVNLDRNETINNKEINIYNAILWVLDESYLPTDKTNSENTKIYDEAEYKKVLLDKAGVPYTQQSSITKDDIEVIQQLAVWYFANYDEQTAGTKPTVSQATKFPAQFLSINGDNNIDSSRKENLNRLYQYLIYGAIDNADSYKIDEETKTRTKVVEKNEFDKTTPLTITSINISAPGEEIGPESYYKIGPIKIKNDDVNVRTGEKTVDATNIVLYDAEGNSIDKLFEIPEEDQQTGEIISGGNHVIYEFIDGTGNPVTQLEKGNTYYIKFKKAFEKGSTTIPYIDESEQYDVSKVKVKIISSYSLSTTNFLYKENTDQAIVEIEKEKISEEDEITTQSFDLSLRKFIISINGRELTGEDSRIPKIDLSKLNTTDSRTNKKITTATYTHPKNALLVETNDKVIYTIRIYNEGELDGTATEITDYLPEGLELVPVSESTINTTYGWKTSDGRTITTDYLKDTNIKAYDPTKTSLTTGETGWQKAAVGDSGLYYADVQIECKVVAEVGSQDQSLRNIAAITEDNGDDIDSEPKDPGRDDYNPPEDNSTYKEDDDDYEDLVLPTKKFDLALRKNITTVNTPSEDGTSLQEERTQVRTPSVDVNPLIQGKTTADYKHRKDPVEVKTGDVVTYKFSVYNEGDIDGYVTSIIDYLPEGLEFDTRFNTNFIEYKETYTETEIEGKEYSYKIEGNKLTILPISKDNLFELKAFDGENLDSKSIDVKLKVTAETSNKDKVLTNVATMTYKAVNADVPDIDSKGEEFTVPASDELLQELPGYKGNENNKNDLSDTNYHYAGQQDDDDFEKIIIKGEEFDLSLRKYISSINGIEPETSRVPQIDTSKLNTIDSSTGKKITTATYKHSKEPLIVKKGDIVTYKIRVYNEGQRDGYATKVADYLPDGLGFLYTDTGDINSEWFLSKNVDSSPLYGKDGIYTSEQDVLKKEAYKKVFGDDIDLSNIQVVQGNKNQDGTREMLQVTAGGTIGQTEIKATELIKAYGSEAKDTDLWQQSTNDQNDGLFYQELEITCIVLKENTYTGILKNVAEITGAQDSEGNEIKNVGDDRDSEPNNVYEDQNHTPGTEIDGYTPGEQDDDDFEPLQLKYFDLALRKFITGVETNGKTENVTSRIPVPKIGDDGNIVYEHSKEPVYVANNDTVVYTIRVYNEGTIAGYAEEITDDIPEGLEYLPEHDVNKQYEWKMYDKDGKVTDKLDEAETIKTEYLSEARETEERDNLIAPFDSSKAISTEKPLNPDYKDVKVAFKVTEPNTSDRIIINSAQISEDSDDDEDSIPDEWNDGEDDQDKEYIYVKYFDLSLLKWVTKTIVTVDGKTTTTETGFKPNTGKTETTGIRDNNEAEPIAKVELDRKKLSSTTVKFVYKIRVTNEGEIEGYATEITDFIPEGLEFKIEDNKAYGWVKEGDNKVTTRALETKLLKPGESAEVEIVFTWKNDTNNLGLKTNIAEITEDYNEHNSKDIDSTPENKKDPYEKEQEDDDDFALVILSIKTGKGASYALFITAMLALLTTGIYLVKKYVLTD